MQDFPSNSQKAKATDAPREKIKPVTSAETRDRKRGLGRQFKETFFAGNAREAASGMVEEVVVPGIRDMLHDAVQGGIERFFYGERTARPRRNSSQLFNQATGHVAYDGISKQPTGPTGPKPRMLSRQSRAMHDFQDLVIPTRGEANEVLDNMFEWISRFGRVTVADLYELTGVRSEHTDVKWGWTSLRGAKAVRLRNGGFLLDLPEPEPLA